MSDTSFVRLEMLPGREPPANKTGVMRWLEENLFSSWMNSVLTILSAGLIIYSLNFLLSWAISPTWNATSLANCREILHDIGRNEHFTGACWGVIRERWIQILFGFYPSELYWRPILALMLLFVALSRILFANKVPHQLIWLTAVYPFLMPWLLWGGSIWVPVSVATGLTAGFYTYVLVSRNSSSFAALLATIAVALFWVIWAGGQFVDVLSSLVLIELEPVASRKFGGMMLSVTIGVVAIGFSLPIGIVLALGRQSNLLIVKALCTGFIEFIRGVPLITLLFVASTLLNIFMPPGTEFDIIMRVIIMVTLFASAYMAETIRGGLAALPRGQYEGADSLGLTYWQSRRLIIMPQALKISIPGIVSTFINLFKDTTLVSVIGLLDPLGLSTAIRADADWNGIVWELYGFIALLFFIACFSMSRYSMYLERRLQTGLK